jgi:hypothetical protein
VADALVAQDDHTTHPEEPESIVSTPIPTSTIAPGPAARGVERRAAVQRALLGVRADERAAWTIRPAHAGDAAALHRLAELDDAAVPREPLLLAEVDGIAVAAIGVLDRRVIADPWTPTAAAVDLLQAAATELRGAERRRRWTARLGRSGRTDRASHGSPRAAA